MPHVATWGIFAHLNLPEFREALFRKFLYSSQLNPKTSEVRQLKIHLE